MFWYSMIIGAVLEFCEVFWYSFLDFYIFRTFKKKIYFFIIFQTFRKKSTIFIIFLFRYSKVIGAVWEFFEVFCFTFLEFLRKIIFFIFRTLGKKSNILISFCFDNLRSLVLFEKFLMCFDTLFLNFISFTHLQGKI